MKRWVRLPVRVVLLAGLFAAAGCGATPEKLNRERRDAIETAGKLTERNEALQAELVTQRKQIDSLVALGDKRLEKVFHVTEIKLGRYTAGVDTDGDSGDDGVKVYLTPMDQDGSVIKAAGDVTVQLYDLAAPQAGNLVGRRSWTVDQISRQWHGGFGVYHYSFVCPWTAGPPAHDEITVRVEFVDYLTGRHFAVQKTCKVKPSHTGEAAK